jgi:hypothetical protein
MLHNNSAMVFREEGDEGAILFDPDTGALWLLNSTAALVYKLCDRWQTHSSIMDVLKKTYDRFGIAEESKVNELIAEFRRIGAITAGEAVRNAKPDADS